MRNIYLLSVAAVALISLVTCPSCKKTTHPTNPTPANTRLLSYTKLTTEGGLQISESYAFYYDASNRVSYMLYSTNDAYVGYVGKRTVFTYNNDTIIKTVTNVKTNKLLETDTFVQTQGQITTVVGTYSNLSVHYFGKLLSSLTQSFNDTGTNVIGGNVVHDVTTVSSSVNYTSDNADLLNTDYEGNLTASFPSLTPPLSVTWIPFLGANVTHNGVAGNSDILTGYNGFLAEIVVAKDINGRSDTGGYPGGGYATQTSYKVYPGNTNTIGDYLQINSFTTYGYNFYQNAHLVKTITTLPIETNVSYTIDGFSKVTQIVASTDTIGKPTPYMTEVYNLQYETY